MNGWDNLCPCETGHSHGSAGAEAVNCVCLQVVQLGFDQNYGLFTSTGDGLAYPNPAARSLPGGLALLELVGLIVGKVRDDQPAASLGGLHCLQQRSGMSRAPYAGMNTLTAGTGWGSTASQNPCCSQHAGVFGTTRPVCILRRCFTESCCTEFAFESCCASSRACF